MGPAEIMNSLSLNSSSDSTTLSVPKLRDDGSNWSDYQSRIERVMGSKGLWRHMLGTDVAPKPFVLLNGIPGPSLISHHVLCKIFSWSKLRESSKRLGYWEDFLIILLLKYATEIISTANLGRGGWWRTLPKKQGKRWSPWHIKVLQVP